jgi:hypothetical protein
MHPILSDCPASAPFLKVLWIVAAIFSTLYAYWWDIVMDWGLLHRDCPNKFLRKKILFAPSVSALYSAATVFLKAGHLQTYYLAMVSNFFLRVSWVLTISPSFFRIVIHHEVFFLGIALLEILRRGQWSIFRVENEHLNNCGKFRVVNVVPPVVDDPEDLSSPYDISPGQVAQKNPEYESSHSDSVNNPK